MEIRDMVESIPNIIASLYESVYIFSKSKNVFYDIKYNGEELRVSSPLEYDKINDVIRNFKDFSAVNLEENEFKKVITTINNKEKLVTLITNDE